MIPTVPRPQGRRIPAPSHAPTDGQESFVTVLTALPWYAKLFLLFLCVICVRIFTNEAGGARDIPHTMLWVITFALCAWLHYNLRGETARAWYKQQYIPAPLGPLRHVRGIYLFVATLAMVLFVMWMESAALNYISIPTAAERQAFSTEAQVSPLKVVRDYAHEWVVTQYHRGGLLTAFLALPGFSAEHCLTLTVALILVYVRVSRVMGLRLFVNHASTLAVVRCLRICTFMATRLPTPNAKCIEERFSSAPLPTASGFEVFIWSFTKISPGGGCHDLVFSGHTTWYVLTVCILTYFCHDRKLAAIIAIGTLHTALGTIRHLFHYSVDIVIAVYTTILVYFYVHRVQVPREVLQERDDEVVASKGHV